MDTEGLGVLLSLFSAIVAPLFAYATRLRFEENKLNEKEERLRSEVAKVMGKLARSDPPRDPIVRDTFYEEHRRELNDVVVAYFDNLSLLEYAKDAEVRKSVLRDLHFAKRMYSVE